MIYDQTKVHPSWQSFLKTEILTFLASANEAIGTQTNPEQSRILRFLEIDCHALKVVILGQDPYPAKGVATGRAFEVGGLTSWFSPFRQVSLKNILRAVYAQNQICQNGLPISSLSKTVMPSFSELKELMRTNIFQILPPHELFQAWEKQGVLLLNTSFSIIPGVPGSHASIWEPFTHMLLQWLSAERPHLSWFLWGSHAQRYLPDIVSGTTYLSRHPMMCSPSYPDDFLKNPCFVNTADDIDWTGMSVV